jgi:chromosome segregation ATPase
MSLGLFPTFDIAGQLAAHKLDLAKAKADLVPVRSFQNQLAICTRNVGRLQKKISKRSDRLQSVQEQVDKLNTELRDIQTGLDESQDKLEELLLDQKRLSGQAAKEHRDAKAAARREKTGGRG